MGEVVCDMFVFSCLAACRMDKSFCLLGIVLDWCFSVGEWCSASRDEGSSYRMEVDRPLKSRNCPCPCPETGERAVPSPIRLAALAVLPQNDLHALAPRLELDAMGRWDLQTCGITHAASVSFLLVRLRG
jgi:hypothetical protein